jgi:NAD(P)H-flavin reductase
MPQVTVVRNEPAGVDLRWLTFDASLEGHDAIGQFVTATVPGHKPAFFALASSPGERVELLVKTTGDAAAMIGALAIGDTLEVSAPMGKGFPLAESRDRELVVLLNGSGISAARPLVRAEIAAGLPRPVTVLYGVLAPERRSFLSDLEAWANAGVTVHTVVGEPNTGWDGLTGYVQDAAAELGLVRDDVAVVFVGLPIMIEQAKAAYTEVGCPTAALLTNY